jgi:hypothetical protein
MVHWQCDTVEEDISRRNNVAVTQHVHPMLKQTANPINRCWNVNCGHSSESSSNRSGCVGCGCVCSTSLSSASSLLAPRFAKSNLALSNAPVVPFRISSNMVAASAMGRPVGSRIQGTECGRASLHVRESPRLVILSSDTPMCEPLRVPTSAANLPLSLF